MNSYQKLKKEKEELIEQIRLLVTRSNSEEATLLKARWLHQFEIEDQVWLGNGTASEADELAELPE